MIKIITNFATLACLHSYSGLDIMTLANNHMNDYGERPVNFTVDVLNAVGIKSFGVNFGSHDAPQVVLYLA